VRAAARAFAAGTAASSLKADAWSTQEWQYFLGGLPDALSPAQLADLDDTFGLTRKGNSEVLFAWLRIAVRHDYQSAMPALERFRRLFREAARYTRPSGPVPEALRSFRVRFEAAMDGDFNTPQALGAWQKAEIAKWWPMIKAANVKVD